MVRLYFADQCQCCRNTFGAALVQTSIICCNTANIFVYTCFEDTIPKTSLDEKAYRVHVVCQTGTSLRSFVFIDRQPRAHKTITACAPQLIESVQFVCARAAPVDPQCAFRFSNATFAHQLYLARSLCTRSRLQCNSFCAPCERRLVRGTQAPTYACLSNR